MLASERQDHLVQLIESQEVVRTLDLADLYQVSAETIRRDFLLLEQAGKLRRIHGGAQSLTTRSQLQSFSQRENIQTKQKQAIARTALQLIHADSIYGFDSSTTALALVNELPDLAYRAITNSHRVLEHLTHYKQVELISTGGRYQSKTQTYVGGTASIRSGTTTLISASSPASDSTSKEAPAKALSSRLHLKNGWLNTPKKSFCWLIPASLANSPSIFSQSLRKSIKSSPTKRLTQSLHRPSKNAALT